MRESTAIERLVVERIVVAWLSLAWMDRFDVFVRPIWSIREVAAHAMRMKNAANRNYLHSIKYLALIRKAALVLTVNVKKTVTVKERRRTAGAGVGRLEGLGAGRN